MAPSVEFKPPIVAIADEDAAQELKTQLGGVRGVQILAGPEATETLRVAFPERILSARGLGF